MAQPVNHPGLRVALAQMNALVGDIAGNTKKIITAIKAARAAGADVLLTPELMLCGYPPEDLLYRPLLYIQCQQALVEIAKHCEGIALVIGYPAVVDNKFYNAAAFIRDGKQEATYCKLRLPNYQVFDEARYFSVGGAPCLVEIKGVRCALTICADLWYPESARLAREEGADLVFSINASPFHDQKHEQRLQVLGECIRQNALGIAYVNMVGGQDELVFDGGSLLFDANGKLAVCAPMFTEELLLADWQNGRWQCPSEQSGPVIVPVIERIYRALVLGVRDYVNKNGFPGVLIGLSGGIDSALTVCIAAAALGPERVHAVMMASPYTAQMSVDDSRALVARLNVRYDEIAIAPAMQTYGELLAGHFEGKVADTAEENIQSRIRGNILMALSNKFGDIVLTTGNKSEMATGYATLYGDMAGGFGVLRDVYKTVVYDLARWINLTEEIIPHNIIERPPSAELKPDQRDQDSLPEYDVLDAIIRAYMEENFSANEIVAQGFAPADVERTVTLLKRNEYKRRQAAVGVRVTERGFGKDWRFPITSGFVDAIDKTK